MAAILSNHQPAMATIRPLAQERKTFGRARREMKKADWEAVCGNCRREATGGAR